MKKLLLLLAPLFFLFVTVTSPAYAGAPSSEITSKVESFKKDKTSAKESKIASWTQKVKNAINKPLKALGDSQAVALVLCFFLGGLGIHRVYLGGSGKLILFYLLLSLIGIGYILVLIDFIALIVAGTGPFSGNDNLLAAFDAFK